MTETAKRIRWTDTHRGVPRIEGSVGSLDAYLFAIYPPGDGPGHDARWLLCCRLPGSDALSAHADDPEPLKAEAERWLEEFVSSLGASFPEGECPECGFRPPTHTHDKDCSRYLEAAPPHPEEETTDA